MISTEFLLTSLVVVLIPGTGVIYTVSTGLFTGWKNSIAAATGCTAGIIPHLIACILGLSAVLHMSAVVFSLFKYAGAGYLLYLAWSMWRTTGLLEMDQTAKAKGLWKIGIRGVLINILNPKLSVFFLAFLPLFVQTGAAVSPFIQMVVLSVVFMAMTWVIFVLYGLLSSLVSSRIMNSPKMMKRIQRTFAVMFAGLAVKLALSEN